MLDGRSRNPRVDRCDTDSLRAATAVKRRGRDGACAAEGKKREWLEVAGRGAKRLVLGKRLLDLLQDDPGQEQILVILE